MAVSSEETASIEAVLRDELGLCNVTKIRHIDGGLVNKAALFDSDQAAVFVKYASRNNAYAMFDSELRSLELIARTGTVKVPNPTKVLRQPGGGALIVMEYLTELEPLTGQWADLGYRMARLHAHNTVLLKTADKYKNSVHGQKCVQPIRKFGFDKAIHYGPKFAIPAVWCDTWEEFFMRHMLKPQFDELEQNGSDRDLLELWPRLQMCLHKAFQGADLQPSLVHGDFCSINVGQVQQQAVVFDPCSHYAPHETDLTILNMDQEDFDQAFFDAYHSLLPKQKDYALRMKAQLLFAYTMCLNIPGEDTANNYKLALKYARELLQLLE